MNTTRAIKQIAITTLTAGMVALGFAACTNVDRSTAGAMNDRVADTKSASSADKPAANEVQIVIENFAFVPSEVTVAPGTTVTWINKDEAPHTATSTEKKFNSGGLDTDDRFSFVFNDKGEFSYFCALHPHMTATVTVK